MDRKQPSLWHLICWIEDVNSEAGIESINYQEFLEQVMFFYSQRHTDKGAENIFQLLDLSYTDEIGFEQFKEILKYGGFNISEQLAEELFVKATGSIKTNLDVKMFNEIMRGPYEIEYKFDDDA